MTLGSGVPVRNVVAISPQSIVRARPAAGARVRAFVALGNATQRPAQREPVISDVGSSLEEGHRADRLNYSRDISESRQDLRHSSSVVLTRNRQCREADQLASGVLGATTLRRKCGVLL